MRPCIGNCEVNLRQLKSQCWEKLETEKIPVFGKLMTPENPTIVEIVRWKKPVLGQFRLKEILWLGIIWDNNIPVLGKLRHMVIPLLGIIWDNIIPVFWENLVTVKSHCRDKFETIKSKHCETIETGKSQ